MYVSLDHVVSFSKTIIKDADSIDINTFREWVYYSLLFLGISDDELDVAELIPQNSIAALPPHCRHIYELSLFDSAGNQLNHKFRTGKVRIFSDNRSNVVGGNPIDVSNDRNNIILGTNGGVVGKILIRYFKYPLDENGQPLIREDDVIACAHFVKYMKALRDDENQSKIAQYDSLWKLHADKAKAAKKMNSMTPEKAKTILAEGMRHIPQFNQSMF